MASASDNFNRADSTTTLGANWTAAIGTWGIFSNEAYCPTPSSSIGSVFYSAISWGPNHYSQASAGAFYATQQIGPAIKVQASGKCYTVLGNHIYYYDGATLNSISTGAYNFVSTDVIQLSYGLAFANQIQLKKNGSLIDSVIDSTLTGGSPGMFATLATETLNDWSGDDGVSTSGFLLVSN